MAEIKLVGFVTPDYEFVHGLVADLEGKLTSRAEFCKPSPNLVLTNVL